MAAVEQRVGFDAQRTAAVQADAVEPDQGQIGDALSLDAETAKQHHVLTWEMVEESDDTGQWLTESFLSEGKTALPMFQGLPEVEGSARLGRLKGWDARGVRGVRVERIG